MEEHGDITMPCGSVTNNNSPVKNDSLIKRDKILYSLHMAHEIAMSSSLNVNNPPDPLRDAVRKNIHSAFWEMFKQEIEQDPPVLSMALSLLQDIKEGLFEVMTPNVVKLKASVEQELDIEHIKQQAENNTIDVKSYARYIISVMSRICAPIRDDLLDMLSKEDNIIAIFRGILEALDIMKMDLINYAIKSITPEIIANQMDYERQKFNEYVDIIGGSMPVTESWLSKHKDVQAEDNISRNDNILHTALLDILIWKTEDPYPETLFMDTGRLIKLKREFYIYSICASIVIIAISCMPSDLSTNIEFKETLKEHVYAILNGITSDETLKKFIPNITAQIKKDANEKLALIDKPYLSDFHENAIELQIKEVADNNNKVRDLVCKRIRDYLKSSLLNNNPSIFPPALILFQHELTAMNFEFRRVSLHSINICGSHYSNILAKLAV